MRSCLGLMGLAALLVAAAVAGWVKRDEISDWMARFSRDGEPAVEAAATAGEGPGPEEGRDLSRRVERKIISLGQGEADQVALTVEELNGWIEHGLQGFFPDFVGGVAADIDADDRLVLAGKVAIREIPGLEAAGAVAGLVGDTAPVIVRGRLDGLAPGRGVYYVEGVQVGPLPLPESVREDLIGDLVGPAGEGLPPGAVTFELPAFVTDVAVRNGRVYLRGCGGDC